MAKQTKKKSKTKVSSKYKMETVVVNRRQWLVGSWIEKQLKTHNKYFFSALYNPYCNKMCCIGFVSLKCGYTKKQISGLSTPARLDLSLIEKGSIIERLLYRGKNNRLLSSSKNNAVCKELMKINDDRSLSNKIREAKLKETGLKIGIKFVFKN